MEQKYTMEEFKEMINRAEKEVIKQLNEEFTKAIEETHGEGAVDPMQSFIYDMQNMMTISMLKAKLFKDNK